MKGSGVPSQNSSPLPVWQPPKRQLQRKYYIMRCDFFQGLYEFLKGNYFMRNYEELNGVIAGQKSEVTYQQGLKGCDCLLKNLGVMA